MSDPLSATASVAQVTQLAVSAGAAAKAAKDRRKDSSEVAVQSIDGTMAALFKYSLFSQVSPEVAAKFELFEADFLELNSKFEDAFEEQKFHQWLLQTFWMQNKPIEELNKKMKRLHIRIVAASADAEQKYRKVARTIQADYTHELDIKMLKSFTSTDSMSIDEFINQVARRAATTLLPAESVEIYLTLLTHKLHAIGKYDKSSGDEPESVTNSQAETDPSSSYPPQPQRRNSMSAAKNPFADPAAEQNATEMERLGHGERAKAKMKSIFKRP
ncbi:hypothetical protein VKT23_013708 [Stygiomarasmius scandens]|uniref:Gag protein n=1 Tax=Marasmiellus scandens TaxID=2682957 RepID=A0ABR1J6Y1_9AGAR